MSATPTERALYFAGGALVAASAALALRAYAAAQSAAQADAATIDAALGPLAHHQPGAAAAASAACAAASSSTTTPTRPLVRSRRPSTVDSAFPTGGASLKTARHPDGLGPLAPEQQQQVAPPVIVGVAGASGSGKTCVAQLIEERLDGVRVVSISSDSYYKGLPPGMAAAEHNWDHPDSIDMALLAAHLSDLRAGRDVTVPEYDFKLHQRSSERSTFISARDTDVVIVDGIFVLAVEALRREFDLTLFTVEELDVCLARRLRRDIAERGRSIESVLAQYLRFVRPGYINFIEPSKNWADVLVPRARDNVVAIEMVAKEIARRVGLKQEEAAQARESLAP